MPERFLLAVIPVFGQLNLSLLFQRAIYFAQQQPKHQFFPDFF